MRLPNGKTRSRWKISGHARKVHGDRRLADFEQHGPSFPEQSPPQGMHPCVDSRTSQDFSIRRRRECLSCERRFTTYERIEESPIRVIKKDGTRVPFDREKIRSGVEKACYKRPVSPEQIDQLVGNVEAAIYEDGEREVPSRRIGELVFLALRELDKVAFVRFASVYREFQDVHDFVEELQPILDRSRRDHLR